MNSGAIVLVTAGFGFIIFLIQRTEPQKRRGVSLFMSLFALMLVWFIGSRQIWGEGLAGFFLALFLNYLFWILIGRYNPVGSSDNIRVLGMDD